MSCGPAELVKDISANIEQTLDIADKALTVLPLKIASIPGYVEAQLISSLNEKVQLIKQLLENPLDALGGLIPGLPADIQQFINDYGGIAAGVAGAAIYLNDLKEKYSDLDVDIDNIVGILNEVGNDLELLCEIVPNIQDIGGEFVFKGLPLKMPEINVAKIIKEGEFPDIVADFKNAVSRVDVDVILDPDKQGFTVSEAPGEPYRMNGRPRFARKRNRLLDDLSGGNPFGSLQDGFGGNVLGDILDQVEGAVDNVFGVVDQAVDQVVDTATDAINNAGADGGGT